MSSLQQNWRKGQDRFWEEEGGNGRLGGEMTQTMYARMNIEYRKKCKKI
jgi:hypothetical protein